MLSIPAHLDQYGIDSPRSLSEVMKAGGWNDIDIQFCYLESDKRCVYCRKGEDSTSVIVSKYKRI